VTAVAQQRQILDRRAYLLLVMKRPDKALHLTGDFLALRTFFRSQEPSDSFPLSGTEERR